VESYNVTVVIGCTLLGFMWTGMAAGGQAEVIKIQGKYKLLPSVGKLLANGTILLFLTVFYYKHNK